MSSNSNHWFKRRRYGWGWRPVTWQGWMAIGFYFLIIIAGALMIVDVPEGQLSRELGVYLLVVLLATASLLRVSYRYGPRPKWRWSKHEDDDPRFDF